MRLYIGGCFQGQAELAQAETGIAPEDVTLSLSDFRDTSARNVLKGKIMRVSESRAQSLWLVDLGGGNQLLSEITQSSFQRLNLRPGLTVYCLFKATVVNLVSAGD